MFNQKNSAVCAFNSSGDGCRIAIIGNAAGGKTTFALKLGEDLLLPVFHIDSLQWNKCWQRKLDSVIDNLENLRQILITTGE